MAQEVRNKRIDPDEIKAKGHESELIMEEIKAIDSHGKEHRISIDKRPDTCPICKRGIQVIPKTCAVYRPFKRDNQNVQAIYVCPLHDCFSIFIAYYGGIPGHIHQLSGTAPFKPTPLVFPEVVQSTSPNFCAVYQQAADAEALRLDRVCGVGYRKALEFLIKDYAILHHPDESELIKKSPLSQCINKYINDEMTRACAERATWLGNDETHYERIWKDKDLDDLKALTTLTVNFMHSESLAEKYKKDMPDKK